MFSPRIIKNSLLAFGRFYMNRWWPPALAFIVLLGACTATAFAPWKPFLQVAAVLVFAAALAFVSVLFAAATNLCRKKWALGLLQLSTVLGCLAAGVAALYLIMLASFRHNEDGFADHLSIPQNIPIAEPAEWPHVANPPGLDTFQDSLLASLKAPGSESTEVTANIGSLLRLQKENPSLLRRYLASSPAWRVFKERDSIFATRRWTVNGQWKYTLHGYYSQHDLGLSEKPRFESRVTIGLSGKPWWHGNSDTTWLKPDERANAKLSNNNQINESHCVISNDTLALEIFEQSDAKERRLTKAALNFLEQELAAVAEQKEAHFCGFATGSAPSLGLMSSFQPGIYESVAWINPGESGMVYLKAFEITKGTLLSTDSLKEYSNEFVGWSDNSQELFFYNTHFTIYEGDWGKPYAARFELWFVPDAGGPERKLLEKNYKIEGWQR